MLRTFGPAHPLVLHIIPRRTAAVRRDPFRSDAPMLPFRSPASVRPHMFNIVLSFITAFALSYMVMPGIIKIALDKNLTAQTGERHVHKKITPSLGGISIFIGMVFSIILWTPFETFGDLQYILCGMLLLFIMGVKDDIIEMSALRKLVGQVLAAGILVFKSGILLTSLYGIFGVTELPYPVSVALSIFIILVIINSFNLIDGINGLSGSVTVVVCLFFGIWFMSVDEIGLAIMAFATMGSVVAFLRYNFPKADIFMGDTGSLILGLMMSVLAIRFIELQTELPADNPYHYASAPAMAVAILILPLFDTLRVFALRAMRGRSPLSPDRNHVHHLLIDSGLSHAQATIILVSVNCIFIFLVIQMQGMGNAFLMLVILGLAVAFMIILQIRVMRKRRLKKRLEI